jgi:hypothetical protein
MAIHIRCRELLAALGGAAAWPLKFIAGLGCAAAMVLTFLGPVRAQDLMRHLALTSSDMTAAEMTRADDRAGVSPN